MFRKRIKIIYPPGTFIEMPARMMAILQLCIVFSIILCHLSQPFMGDHFAIKSRLLVIDKVMDKSNQVYFDLLPVQDKETILDVEKRLKKSMDTPFVDKIGQSIYKIGVQISPFERLWLVLGIAVPLLLLKKAEGARLAVWLLPVIVLCYSVDNYWNAKERPISEEARLFPSEQEIVDRYLKEPLSSNIFEQREQLIEGWRNYLISEWAKETPSENLEESQCQLKKGEFFFHAARVVAQKNEQPSSDNVKEPTFLLILYFCWNLLLAIIAFKPLFLKPSLYVS